MRLFKSKKIQMETPQPFSRTPLMTISTLARRPFFRKPQILIALSLVCIGTWWIYSHSHGNQTKALELEESTLSTVGTDTLDFLVQTPINLDELEEKDHKPFEYEVEAGDTLSNIAQRYSLKLSTLLWANNLSEKSIIKPGQTLTMLPIDGVLHKVEKGETLSEIAKIHKADPSKTIAYNELDNANVIFPGDFIIVPDGRPAPVAQPTNQPSRGTIKGKFVWPTNTKNITQGYSAKHRGLDIANGTRGPIYAAHDGTVQFSGKDGAWGNTVVIRGNDGLVTRYAHATENYVETGQKVNAGQTIAKVGNTGNVRGVTGIHLHFGVYKNGVAINPMSVLR